MESIINYLVNHGKIDMAVAYLCIIFLFKLAHRCHQNNVKIWKTLAEKGCIREDCPMSKAHQTTPSSRSIPRPTRHAQARAMD